jgi:electron-transferring-flavoprotein dehydrogenase
MSEDRLSMDVDIVCVGFGPAMGGFLSTLAHDPDPNLQVVCYERADDIGFGVSGAVTRARGIRTTFPDLDPAEIPMAAAVRHEKIAYLLDPLGTSRRAPSRRSKTLRAADRLLRLLRLTHDHAFELPWTPPFLRKDGGLLLSIGQFMQWTGAQAMGSGAVQIWPGMPVSQALVEGERVVGVRLLDQGTDREGHPDAGYMPGMDLHAALTVVGDGPVGAVGRQLDALFGLPAYHHQHEWAVGAKMVVDLREDVNLEPGTVFHTFGYPEPEIFGFFYVHPNRVASVGIFVPSWFHNPARTSYRYLQHYMLHPYLWRYLERGKLRSWGAKSLQEAGKRGEPFLAGDGYARIGECSGSTNVLTGSGVDEAWTTGIQLAEAVKALRAAGKAFTKANLEETYVARRRASWVEGEGRIAEKARDGFHHGVVTGLIGMALAGATKGRFAIAGEPQLLPNLEEYYRGKLTPGDIDRVRHQCYSRGVAMHDALMDCCGWPSVPFDGQLLMSQQDALLVGGKVQAPAGYAGHVTFLYPDFCERCSAKLCIEMCSGQALTPGPNGVPLFDREKCVFCGACLWNCRQPLDDDPVRTNVAFRAGAGGLHSTEN